MDPNQQPTQPQPPVSIDYLNQIAPQVPVRKLPFTKTQMIIFGILAAALIIVLILAITLNGSGSKKPTQQLAARLQTTQVIVVDAKTKLKSSQLRALNSNLDIYLTNTTRDIAAPLLKDKVDIAKLDASVVSSESAEDVSLRLEDARLNAIYDRTYAREIAYRLETIVSLMRQIYESTNNNDLKTFLDNAFTNLEPTQKAFEDFNEANA